MVDQQGLTADYVDKSFTSESRFTYISNNMLQMKLENILKTRTSKTSKHTAIKVNYDS